MEYMEKYHKISTYVVNMFLSIYEVNQKRRWNCGNPIFLVIYYKKAGNDQTISNKHFSTYSKSWVIITH